MDLDLTQSCCGTLKIVTMEIYNEITGKWPFFFVKLSSYNTIHLITSSIPWTAKKAL